MGIIRRYDGAGARPFNKNEYTAAVSARDYERDHQPQQVTTQPGAPRERFYRINRRDKEYLEYRKNKRRRERTPPYNLGGFLGSMSRL
jgi:hypothetical protein